MFLKDLMYFMERKNAMNSYRSFADYYDILTQDIPYEKRGEYFNALIKQNGINSGILLDLACGTGTLSEVMYDYGYDVIGVDESSEMLAAAQNKKYNSGKDILYLCQSMQKLDLYGTIDVCICALDSLNHILEIDELQKAVDRVSLFLRPGGVFIFDVNTVYKHEKVLADQVFIYDYDEVYCVWQNSSCHDNIVDFTLDLFENDGECYYRETEQFSERAYTFEELKKVIEKSGLIIFARYDEDSQSEPCDTSERVVYVTKKP